MTTHDPAGHCGISRGHEPELINGVWADVATAPEPQLSITGHHALITEVRFVWTGARCIRCRRSLRLFTDGGRVEAGINIRQTRSRSGPPQGTAAWYTIYRPAGAPTPPGACPDPHCPSHHRSLPNNGWIDGLWTLTVGPIQLETSSARWTTGTPLPAHPQTHRLLNQVWDHLRASYPELAALADEHENSRHQRRPRRV